jgi:starch synthase
MNVLMVAAEMTPLAKVGGLADVVGALPAALARRGHDVRVVLPRYADLAGQRLGPGAVACDHRVPLRVGDRMRSLHYRTWTDAPAGVTVDLVDVPGLFDRPGVYAGPDGVPFGDGPERWAALAQAALMLPELADWPVDVLHAHDAQAALVPVLRRQWYADRSLPGPGGTLLTIHNLAHQEQMAAGRVVRLGLPGHLVSYPGPLEFWGQANLLKGGILTSDRVNTVSATYAREVTTAPDLGCGLAGVLDSLGDRFGGIPNGVDHDVWDPSHDPHLDHGYGPDDLAGKTACREALLAELALDASPRPLLGMVSRLVPQKGLDLLMPLLDRLAAGGYALVVLGTGEARYHDQLAAAAARHPGRVAFVGSFSEALAHRIYAGCDAFLMPSVFEPCGLSQLYAMRYGTPPVVRATGGLADTVADADARRGTGFVFDAPTAEALWAALERVRAAFAAPARWRALQRRGMMADHGWDAAAAAYERTYESVLAGAMAEERTRS